MKTSVKYVVTLLALTVLALTGCVGITRGSGTPVTREFEFTDFDTVSISHAFQGIIMRGDDYRVVVTIDDNLEESLRVEQDGRHVRIGFENVMAVTDATMEYEITLPALSSLNLSGASGAQLSGFASTDPFAADISGASRLHGDIDSGDATFEASGASNISLAGEGGSVRANASGASTIDLEEFTSASADVEASGASNVTVNTSGRLDARASGASTIHYVGDPTLGTLDESGGSSIGPR